MLNGEDTGVAIRASKSFVSLIRLTQTVWMTIANGIDAEGPGYAQQVEQLLLQGVSHVNSQVAIRYYELAVMLSKISQQAFSMMAAAAINQVLQSFFDKDALT